MNEDIIKPETVEIKKEHVIKIDDNKIIIEMNNNEIIFTLIINLSFNKYIKRFKFDEFKKKFEISESCDINDIYYNIINYDYEINENEKKIIFENNEIKLEEEIKLTNEEMINELIFEIKKIKKEKNELEKQLYELDDIINEDKEDKDKYKKEINLIYNAGYDKKCQIFGDKFVENNKNKIELNINGKNTKLVSKYK